MKTPKEKAEFSAALLDWAQRRDAELGDGATIKVREGELSPFSANKANPFFPTDLAAEDETCAFELVESLWGQIDLPAGRMGIAINAGVFDYLFRGLAKEPPFDRLCRYSTRDRRRGLEENRDAIGEWLAHNLKYCYFQPRDKRILLDTEARTKGIPSKEYRKDHPWNWGTTAGPREN
jgi:hypothetical protein